MCGRYTLLKDEMQIRMRFDLEQDLEQFNQSYNIAPGQNVLSIIHDGEKRRAGHLRWGLVPFWAKDEKIGYKMINARSETIHEKPSFRQLLTRKHCLIIADSFYEWQKTEQGKTPLRIQPPNKRLFAFAGLWEKWQKDNEKLFTCTILTRASNHFMEPIHHRMPVILPEDKEAEWIEADFANKEDAQQFIQELKPEELTTYQVSDYVNHAKNNDRKCIEPVSAE